MEKWYIDQDVYKDFIDIHMSGKDVYLICTVDNNPDLTFGKKYKVYLVYRPGYSIRIGNDNGKPNNYSMDFFTTKERYRELRLRELLE